MLFRSPINSVWWSWTAPITGTVNINTIGSNFDTWLSVFTGSDLPNLTLVAANDDGGGNLTSLITQSVTAGTTYKIAVDGYSSATGQINLNIAPTPPGGGAANLTETANAADSKKDLVDPSAGNAANNTLKGEADKDPLTGGPAGDTLMLPFAQSSVSPSDEVTDFVPRQKIDFVTEGGAAMNAPSLFSPAANSTVPTLVKDLSPVTEPNGALAGNQPLGINSDPFAVAKTSAFADPYLVGMYDAKPFGI